jgi:hypothetical protein
MTKEIIAGVVALAGVAGGGWQANEYLHRTFARLEMVLVAGNKADYLMDQRIGVGRANRVAGAKAQQDAWRVAKS